MRIVQKTLIDTLGREATEDHCWRKGWLQSVLVSNSKHHHRKLTGMVKKRCTIKKEDDRSHEKIVKQQTKPIQELREFFCFVFTSGLGLELVVHQEEPLHTDLSRNLEMGHKCHIPLVKPLLRHNERQKHLA